MPKHFLSFQTVFIVNENIRWLEEFIVYHKHLGFEHFYLYDNEGTSGGDGTRTTSKRGYPITTTTPEKDKIELNRIIEKYCDCVTIVKWQPTNANGVVEYKQSEAITHFIENYGKDNEWVSFTDLDEYIFSEENINLVDYLKSLVNVSCVIIRQKKFLERFITESQLITQEFQCYNRLCDWARKNIIRCEDFKKTNSIHDIGLKENCVKILPNMKTLRFNHYNFNNDNKKSCNFIKNYLKLDHDPKIDGRDEGMIRYKDIFKDLHSTVI